MDKFVEYENRMDLVSSILNEFPLIGEPISYAVNKRNWVLIYNPTEPFDTGLPIESPWILLTVHFGLQDIMLIDKKELYSYQYGCIDQARIAADIRAILDIKLSLHDIVE